MLGCFVFRLGVAAAIVWCVLGLAIVAFAPVAVWEGEYVTQGGFLTFVAVIACAIIGIGALLAWTVSLD